MSTFNEGRVEHHSHEYDREHQRRGTGQIQSTSTHRSPVIAPPNLGMSQRAYLELVRADRPVTQNISYPVLQERARKYRAMYESVSREAQKYEELIMELLPEVLLLVNYSRRTSSGLPVVRTELEDLVRRATVNGKFNLASCLEELLILVSEENSKALRASEAFMTPENYPAPEERYRASPNLQTLMDAFEVRLAL